METNVSIQFNLQLILITMGILVALTTSPAYGADQPSISPGRLELKHFSNEREIWIDGRFLPENISELTLRPGAHTVIVRQHGETGTLALKLSADALQTVTPSDFRFSHLKPGLRNAGIVLVTLGAATAVTGILLFVYDGECARREPGGKCVGDHTTMSPGIVLSSVSAVMIGTGIALLLRRHRVKKNAMRQFAGEN